MNYCDRTQCIVTSKPTCDALFNAHIYIYNTNSGTRQTCFIESVECCAATPSQCIRPLNNKYLDYVARSNGWYIALIHAGQQCRAIITNITRCYTYLLTIHTKLYIDSMSHFCGNSVVSFLKLSTRIRFSLLCTRPGDVEFCKTNESRNTADERKEGQSGRLCKKCTGEI
jgi:hypothetical protein